MEFNENGGRYNRQGPFPRQWKGLLLIKGNLCYFAEYV